MSRSIRIGMIGFGVVGQGLMRLLSERGEEMEARLGGKLEIVKIAVRDTSRKREASVDPGILTDSIDEILDDPSIQIVVELAGGVDEPAAWMRRALESGKHIVTANKAVIAEKGEELIALAEEKHRFLLFEAAVAGGIPILRVLREALTGDRIVRLHGIVNGTSNYILSRMASANLAFEPALREAQLKGFAEADPSLDINGGDACHKLAILARLAFLADIEPSAIPTQGIDIVSARDMEFALDFGYVIKPLAIGARLNGALDLRVHPALVPVDSHLAHIHGATNAIYLEGEHLGPVMFSGEGAGAYPTAVSVAGDLFEVARAILSGSDDRATPPYGVPLRALKKLPQLPAEELKTPFYLRLTVEDDAGVLADVASALARHRVSIETILQTVDDEEGIATIVLLTHEAFEHAVGAAVSELSRHSALREQPVLLRIVR
ncbi:MAG: homoserine dehydrogenase [Sandaracinaceae bacterium]|nr:homoserine dehydrogenase [Sandaracinaceae bacterium]